LPLYLDVNFLIKQIQILKLKNIKTHLFITPYRFIKQGYSLNFSGNFYLFKIFLKRFYNKNYTTYF
jgi:hypothetical protein